MLEAEKAASRLHSGVQVGRRQGQTGEAKRVRGVGLLRGNDAAARPLVAAVRAGEGDRAYDAVAIHDGRPHVEIESSVCLRASLDQSRSQHGLRRQIAAGGGLIAVLSPCRAGCKAQRKESREQSFPHRFFLQNV